MRTRQLLSSLSALLVTALLAPAAHAERLRIGRVRVLSTPTAASVYVDGASQPTGRAPLWLRLPHGEHGLRVVLDGYGAEERSVTVGARAATIRIELQQVAPLEVVAGAEDVEGAAVLVNGEEVGTIPLRHELTPGRHLLVVRREGFLPHERWIEAVAGTAQSISVTLQREAPRTGTLLVAGDAPGSPVFVDGEAHGATPTMLELAAGQHLVEIRPSGAPPHSEVVVVEAGRRLVVNPTLRPPTPETGTLVVLTEPPGARISVDGTERGVSPLTLTDIAPGAHIVEARAAGRQDAVGRAVVEAGRQESVRLMLEEQAVTGSVRVTSAVPGLEVLIDGERVGRTPLLRDGLSPGEHVVVVRAPGHRDWTHHFVILGSETVSIEAAPGGLGRLSVSTNAPEATVVVNGEAVGPAPIVDHELEAGDHLVEVRAEGFVPFSRRVSIRAGTVAQIVAELPAAAAPAPTAEPAGPVEPPPPAPGASRWRGGSPFAYSAIPMRPYRLSISGAWGYPYLVGNYRIAVGVFDNMDLALEARSSYYFTEVDGHFRYGVRLARIVGLGGEIHFGGGFGHESRSSVLFGVTLWEGLELGPVAVALRQRLQVFWDLYASGVERQVSARVFVGLSVEWRIIGPLFTYLVVDYAPVQPNRLALCGDRVVGESCDHWMRDIGLDARLGVGVTFF